MTGANSVNRTACLSRIRGVQNDNSLGNLVGFADHHLQLLDPNGQRLRTFTADLAITERPMMVVGHDGYFVAGNLRVGDRFVQLVRLRPDGALDPAFQPPDLPIPDWSSGSLNLTALAPDEQGGCFFHATTPIIDSDQGPLPDPVIYFGHVDRSGQVRIFATFTESTAPRYVLQLVPDQGSLIVVDRRGLWRDAASDVLIRAVGPSLQQFGVSPTLLTTRLTVFRGGTPLVTAGFQSNTIPVQWTSARVGAFALDPLSQVSEAQALVQLVPGVYTIHFAANAVSPSTAGDLLSEIYFP